MAPPVIFIAELAFRSTRVQRNSRCIEQVLPGRLKCIIFLSIFYFFKIEITAWNFPFLFNGISFTSLMMISIAPN